MNSFIFNVLFLAYIAQTVHATPIPLNGRSISELYRDFSSRLLEPTAESDSLPNFVTVGLERLEKVFGSESIWATSLDRIAEVLGSNIDDLQAISSRVISHLDFAVPVQTDASAPPLPDTVPLDLDLVTTVAVSDPLPIQSSPSGAIVDDAQTTWTLPLIASAAPVTPQFSVAPSDIPINHSTAHTPYNAANIGVAAALATLLVVVGAKSIRASRRRSITTTTSLGPPSPIIATFDPDPKELDINEVFEKSGEFEAQLVDLQSHIIRTVDPEVLRKAAALASANATKMTFDDVPRLPSENKGLEAGPVLAMPTPTRLHLSPPTPTSPSPKLAFIQNNAAPQTLLVPSPNPSRLPSPLRIPSPDPYIVGGMPPTPPLELELDLTTHTATAPSTTNVPLSLLIPTHQWLLNFLVIIFSWSSFFPNSGTANGVAMLATGRRRNNGFTV